MASSLFLHMTTPLPAAKPSAFTTRDALKRAPSGIDPDHPRIALLRQKGLAVSFGEIPKAVRHTAALKGWLIEQTKLAAPVVKWAFENGVG